MIYTRTCPHRLAPALTMVLLASVLGGCNESSKTKGAGPAAGGEGADIYRIDVGTGRVQRLTTNRGEGALEPSWWPSRSIAFVSLACDGCPAKLHRIRGGKVEEVRVRRAAHVFQPTWAPDGRRIAVVALGRGIYQIDMRSRLATRLTSGISDEAPAWSPRGDLIAFHKLVGGTNYDLFSVNARTRRLRRLTRDPRPQTNPSWSPDGSRIALAEQQPNGNWAIVTMRSNGSDRKRVTTGRTSAQEPAWSPDGGRVAFVEHRLDSESVVVVNANGRGKPRRLTGEALAASKPAWSPDGRSIAFSARAVR